MTTRRKIVLIEPHKSFQDRPFPPIPLLYLEAVLSRRNEFDCEIVDYNIGQSVDPYLSDPSVLAYGITSRTGDSLISAARIARRIKAAAPERPIIWGGVHVTSVPEESAREPFVDVVVRGEGEETLEDLLSALRDRRSLATVPGITFEHNGKIISTDDRGTVDLTDLPPLDYERLDLSMYDTRMLWMNTSRGCPYRCQFCCNAIHPGYRSGMPAELVVEHLRRYVEVLQPELVFFTDYNFFADKKRVRQIATRLCDADIGVQWGGHIVASDACHLDLEDLTLLRRSGCVYLVSGQDGSKEQMRAIRKPCTHDQVDTAIERLARSGIGNVLNYIIGLPEESTADLTAVVHDIKTRESRYGQPINIYIFFPWPGTPILDRIKGPSFSVPAGMNEWSDVLLGDADRLRFHSGTYRRMVQTVYYVTSFAKHRPVSVFQPPSNGRFHRVKLELLRALESVYGRVARVRWEHEFFKWGMEWQLLHALAKMRYRRQRRRFVRTPV